MPLFAPDEVMATVAYHMRSTTAAAEVLDSANATFDDGTRYISVSQAQFRFSQRNRIVVPTNPAAVQLQFSMELVRISYDDRR